MYSFSYFQILFDKNEVPEHSLFNIKLEKRRQNGVHTLLLFDKKGVPQLSLFDVKSENGVKNRKNCECCPGHYWSHCSQQ